MRISPVRNQDGVVVQHFASISDLTAHKQEQAELKLLVDELNHRVKNRLSTVEDNMTVIQRPFR
jgi:two-component sensor histidine kinase